MEFAKYADLSEARKAEFLEFAEVLVACSTKGRNEGFFALDDYSADVCFILRACRLVVLRLFALFLINFLADLK